MVSQAKRGVLLTLPLTDVFAKDLSIAPSIPTETPRLLIDWRASFTPPLSQVKAAEKLGVPLRNLTRWEKAQHYPTQSSIERIAPIMGLEVSDFYAMEENPTEVTRARLIRIEAMLESLADALLSPAQQKRLMEDAAEAVQAGAEAVASVGRSSRSKRSAAPSKRRRASG